MPRPVTQGGPWRDSAAGFEDEPPDDNDDIRFKTLDDLLDDAERTLHEIEEQRRKQEGHA